MPELSIRGSERWTNKEHANRSRAASAAAMQSGLPAPLCRSIKIPAHHPKNSLLRSLERRRSGVDGAERRYHSRGDRHRFWDDAEALQIWKAAGAGSGERVHSPGACAGRSSNRTLRAVYATCAQPGTQCGDWRQEHRVRSGLWIAVCAQLRRGRRYARIEDFRNFVKLAYMANSCTIRAAPSASRSTCQSTNGTSWCTAT